MDESFKHLRTEDAKKFDGNGWTILDLSKAREVMPYEGERYGLSVFSSNITKMTPDIAQTIADSGFPYKRRQRGIRNDFERHILHTQKGRRPVKRSRAEADGHAKRRRAD